MKLNALFILQIIAHFSAIPMFLFATKEEYIISLITFFFTGCIGMSMTYHRLICHRSWSAPRWLEFFGTLCATIGLTGSSLAWCSVHIEHHQTTDSLKDPHSPLTQPWWKVQFLSMFYKPKIKLLKDKVKDPLHQLCHRNYLLINLSYFILLLVIDPFSVIYAYFFPAAILWNTGSAVNTVGHLHGYKNYPTNEMSRNNIILALVTWGEGWHNNHHKNPNASYFGRKWFEFDISGILIKIFSSKKTTKNQFS